MGWGALVFIFFALSQVSDVHRNIGWFALLSGVYGVYVFHFEVGRLLGFLRAHVPSVSEKLPNSWSFETFAFFSPTLLRLPESTSSPEYNAVHVYRTAWIFSIVSIAVPLLLNWILL